MTTDPAPQRPAAAADRHGPAAATVLVGALLVLVGIGWLLDAGGVGVPWRAILPAALIAVGLACAAGAFQGRQHALMGVGVALMLLLSVAVAADWNLDLPLAGGVGDRSARPATPAELRRYELGVGNFQLDLRQLQVPAGTTAVQARVGIGSWTSGSPTGSRSTWWPAPGLARSRCWAGRRAGWPAGSRPAPATATAACGWTSAAASARSGWNGDRRRR
jgi:hypothetical protein